jgi:PAS domain S-box-containing protein
MPQLQSLLDDHALTAALASLREGIQVVNADWRYLYLNPAAATHGRLSPEALLGRTMQECYPGIERTPMFSLLRDCLDAGASHELLNEFTYPDGSVAWFELRIQRTNVGVLVLSTDATQRLQLEQRLRPPAPAPAPVTGGSEAVLVVDSDEAVLRVIVRELERGGYAVTGARSRAEALARIWRGYRPQLLLTDRVLGADSGLALADQVCVLVPGLRVLVMSGGSDLEDGSGGLSSSVEMLEKPFTPARLGARVRAVLDG